MESKSYAVEIFHPRTLELLYKQNQITSLKKVCNIIDKILSRDLHLDAYSILKSLSERSGNTKSNMISPIMLHRILNGKSSKFWNFIKIKTEEKNTKLNYYDKEDEYLQELCKSYPTKIKYLGTECIVEETTLSQEEEDLLDKGTISDEDINNVDFTENENEKYFNKNLEIEVLPSNNTELEKYKTMTLEGLRQTTIYKNLKEQKKINVKTTKKKLLEMFSELI
tara:strand:- start:992 stop:1663 length:672 start_codon:yes stop_codon:yes gene_type:complete